MDEKKIIQYALGDLDSNEIKEIKETISGSPEAAQFLSEVNAVIEALRSVPVPIEGLTAGQKAALRERCLQNIKNRAKPARTSSASDSSLWIRDIVRFGIPLAAAASICVAFFLAQDWDLPTPASSHPSFPSFAAESQRSKRMSGFIQPNSAAGGHAQKSQSSSGVLSSSLSGTPLTRGLTEYDTYEPTHPHSTQIEHNREGYNVIEENGFKRVVSNPLSTFAVDVDTASYSNVRRFLNDGQLPPAGSVRTEEMLNYFRYKYPTPNNEEAFSIDLESAPAPWSEDRLLVKIGLRGKELPPAQRPSSNLVFLIDTSGSMESADKLPLLKRALKESLPQLRSDDRVSIVSYAGSSGVVLPPTSGKNREAIVAAIDSIGAAGSTAGSAGIELAYELATGEAFVSGGNNRVILCTDGDFNVGLTSQAALESLIETKRATGVFLTVLGFGTGNIQDATMELLANKGNGNYAYIDSMTEARKVMGSELGSTLFTIAKDVKIQVEFNPAKVAGYRLIGYENRLLSAEDFNDDKKDAGEIGAGHTVTAMYELIPAGKEIPGRPSTDSLKYQRSEVSSPSEDLLTVKVRYKTPEGEASRLVERVLPSSAELAQPSEDFNFASAVAAFSMKLSQSQHVLNMSWDDIKRLAKSSLGVDEGSHRAEFLTLVEKAKQASSLDTPPPMAEEPVIR
jgi:Ca-activated chloride channel family protein